MLKCAILKEIFYQDSISGIEKIAYEKNKGRKHKNDEAGSDQLYGEWNQTEPEIMCDFE